MLSRAHQLFSQQPVPARVLILYIHIESTWVCSCGLTYWTVHGASKGAHGVPDTSGLFVGVDGADQNMLPHAHTHLLTHRSRSPTTIAVFAFTLFYGYFLYVQMMEAPDLYW